MHSVSEAATTVQEPAETPEPLTPRMRRLLWIEVALVLSISVGYSAVSSALSFLHTQIAYHGFRGTVSTLNQSKQSHVQWFDTWFDLAYQLLGYARGLAFAGIALYALARTPPVAAAITRAQASSGFGIGVDLGRIGRDAWHGAVLATVIGIPGLGLYFAARAMGLNATIATSGLADTWWRDPALVLSAFQNGALEEIIWVGYLLTRFRQLGWSTQKAIGVSSLIRGSYHLYQGFGGFIGNIVMGVVYCTYYTRTKRVTPLIIAHTIQDSVVFLGYAYLAPHWSFIR